jgi:DnaJ-class molecular chaperone
MYRSERDTQHSQKTRYNPIKDKDNEITINESLVNILSSYSKEIDILRYESCKKCRGFGLSNCNKCSGSGKMKTSYGKMMCNSCNGSGLANSTCTKCKGYGYTSHDKRIKMKFDARNNNLNIRYSEEIGYYAIIKVSGLGNTKFKDEFSDKQVTGDLYLKILIEVPDKIEIDPQLNIVQYSDISLFDLLFNTYNEIINIENRKFRLAIDSAQYLDNISFTVREEGIKTSEGITNYIFKFRTLFPQIDRLTQNEREQLKHLISNT